MSVNKTHSNAPDFMGSDRPDFFKDTEAFRSRDGQTIILNTGTMWGNILSESKNVPYWVSVDGGQSFFQMTEEYDALVPHKYGDTVLRVPGTQKYINFNPAFGKPITMPDSSTTYRADSARVDSFTSIFNLPFNTKKFTAIQPGEIPDLVASAAFYQVPDSYEPVGLYQFTDTDGTTKEVFISESSQDSTVLENQYRIHMGTSGDLQPTEMIDNPFHQHGVYQMIYQQGDQAYLLISTYSYQNAIDSFITPKAYYGDKSLEQLVREDIDSGRAISEHNQDMLNLLDFLGEHNNGTYMVKLEKNPETGEIIYPENLSQAMELTETKTPKTPRAAERQVGVEMRAEPHAGYRDVKRKL